MQRVTIARALYSDPEVLILDEATSAMDMFNENLIADTVRNMKGRLTTIVVAHRLSTVEHCDRILWFENGRLLDADAPGIVLPKYLGALTAKAQ